MKKDLAKYLDDDNNISDQQQQQQQPSFMSINISSTTSSTTISKENETELLDLIQTKQYSQAVKFVKILKNKIPGMGKFSFQLFLKFFFDDKISFFFSRFKQRRFN